MKVCPSSFPLQLDGKSLLNAGNRRHRDAGIAAVLRPALRQLQEAGERRGAGAWQHVGTHAARLLFPLHSHRILRG